MKLSPAKTRIYQTLCNASPQGVSNHVLMDLVSPDCTKMSLKVTICTLRKQLKQQGINKKIVPVWGFGYRIEEGDNHAQ